MKDVVMFVEAFKEQSTGTSLTVQRFRFCTSTVGGMASIPGGGTKILHATRCSQKEESSTDVIQECKERELWETTPYLGMKSSKSSSQEEE